ncbi:MAG: S-adenosyl-L-methionine-dependent uroporphyrinogen III methyltransferase [Methanonatronarchaeales archaeon]|nr:S-adenosyl-L-methionine-dependent uroporphyrinogen III methyltransferase [Methanonatronarchaeales archaeon]
MIYVVGGGPGDPGLLTLKGRRVLDEADVVFASPVVAELLGVEAEPSTRRNHGEVARRAAELSGDGNTVAIVSSGDPGTYGKVDLVLRELAEAGLDADVNVVPGVSAHQAASAALGTPLPGDLCTVSLSGSRDRMTVERRLRHGCRGGFGLALYNPRGHWEEALELLRTELGDHGAAVVRAATRRDASTRLTTLRDPALDDGFDTTTIVVVLPPDAETADGRVFAPRGGEV